MVHLDARCDGVVVPRQFVGQRDLRLNLSYRFSGSAMEIDDSRVEATLTFGGLPFRCRIPLHAIYALTSQVTGAGLVFPESLPNELVSELQEHMTEPQHADQATEDALLIAEGKAPRAARRRREGKPTRVPHLRVIDGEKK